MAKKRTRFNPDLSHLGLTAASSLLAGMLVGIHAQPTPPPQPVVVELAEAQTEYRQEPAGTETFPDRIVDEPYPVFDFQDEHVDADPNRVTRNTDNARLVGGGS